MKVRLPQGNGGAGNMQQLMKQAQQMQEDMANLQAELETREYEVSAGGGAVTVKINGKKEITGLEIDPEIVDPDDVETMADVIIAGVNQAIRTVSETEKAEMDKITGQMPGLGGGLGGGFGF